HRFPGRGASPGARGGGQGRRRHLELRRDCLLDVKQGRWQGKLHVNRTTWLPAMLRWSGVTGGEAWTLSDYPDDPGLKGPGKSPTARGGGMTDTYQVRSVRPAPAAPAGVYAPVTARPEDTRFDPEVSPRIRVRRARTGHVLVRPKVDGLDLGWFIFDTG